MITGRVQFPNQRVSHAEKAKPEWYANCCDYVIEAGVNAKEDNIEEKFEILHGRIPDAYYKKTLNPYNFTEDKYKRYPATMRNYDMMKGIIRRYVGEYIKNPHDFIVGANNPEVVFAKDAKLAQEIMVIAEQAVAAEIQRSYQEFLGQGGDPNQFNPQEQVDIEAFIKEFNEKFIDDISSQGQHLLAVIDDITNSFVLYARAYFEFITFGECYTYSDVDGTNLIKRVVSVRDAFPVPNDSIYVKDYDMFAERRMMTKQQIITEFGDYLSDKEMELLNNTDYYVDMVFYNKYLKSYVLIDLKIGKLKAENLGQMNLYLNYYEQVINDNEDNKPIGIILCAEKDKVMMEFALGGLSNNIFASTYTYYIPDKEQLINEVEKVLNEK